MVQYSFIWQSSEINDDGADFECHFQEGLQKLKQQQFFGQKITFAKCQVWVMNDGCANIIGAIRGCNQGVAKLI